MANDKMMAQMSGKGGFIAALDQSGGSTPGALRLYGIPDNAYSGDAEMFRLVHEMRVRIMTAPAVFRVGDHKGKDRPPSSVIRECRPPLCARSCRAGRSCD